ncbi:MAG: MFS transporter, partial [Blastocatellia bacterium]
GAVLISVFAMIRSLVHLITPDHMRGRVMSVYNGAFRGGMPLGSIIAGAIIQKWSAPPVIAVDGVLIVLLGCFFLFVHRRVAAL